MCWADEIVYSTRLKSCFLLYSERELRVSSLNFFHGPLSQKVNLITNFWIAVVSQTFCRGMQCYSEVQWESSFRFLLFSFWLLSSSSPSLLTSPHYYAASYSSSAKKCSKSKYMQLPKINYLGTWAALKRILFHRQMPTDSFCSGEKNYK